MSAASKENDIVNMLTPPQSATRQLKEDQEEISPLMLNKSARVAKPCALLRALVLIVGCLAVTQYVYGIFAHSSLMSIQFAASALAFISSIELIWSKSQTKGSSNGQGVYLLYRTAGTVFYIACLFLNLTHCLEDISDINAPTHPDVANETTPMEMEEHHEHPISYHTLYISIADLAIKSIYSLAYNALSINVIANLAAFVAPPVFTVLVFLYNSYELDYFFGWLDHHLEPATSILLTIFCIGIAIYSLIRKKQFLLAEGPRNFSIDKISRAVKAKNENLEKVDHVHASCEWPEGFTVSLKAYIRVEKTNKDWVSRAADDFSELKSLLHNEIKAQGAKEVIVEPVFVDRNELTTFVDPICIDRSCHNEDVGCCTIPKTTGEA